MIRDATLDDVDAMADLAARRRADHQRAQPRFWREAPDARQRQIPFLVSQVTDADVLTLVATSNGDVGSSAPVAGFLVATVNAAPPVYDPGGPTGLVDDFAVAGAGMWGTVGRDLLTETRRRLAARGVVQLVVVCGDHDDEKLALLREEGLATVSQWLLLPLSTDDEHSVSSTTIDPSTTLNDPGRGTT